jgi:hypothetical protein
VLLATALAIVAPHFVWLWQNEFITLGWFEERSVGWMTGPLRRIVYPLEFFVTHLVIVVPMLIVLAPAITLFRYRKVSVDEQPPARLLALLVIGPMVIYLLIPLATGAHLRSMWGGPLLTFVPLALLYFCPQRETLNLGAMRGALLRCAMAGCVFLIVAAGRNIAAPRWNGAGSRIHFPGQQLADVVESHWRQRCDRPLPAIGGPWWLAASVACYADDRPSVFGDFNAQKHPWLSDDELKTDGAVFVWLADEHSTYFRDIVRSRFPDAEYLPDATLPWQTSAQLPPVRVCCAILTPASIRAARAPSDTLATLPAPRH